MGSTILKPTRHSTHSSARTRSPTPTNDKLSCRQALLDQLELEKTTGGIVLYLPIEPDDVDAFGSVKPIVDLVLTADTCLVVTGKAPDQDLADIIIAERKYPTRFAYRPDPDEKLRPLALAGADVVLLPSSLGFRGTNAIAAMRYGTLPIVKSSRRGTSTRVRL